MKEYPSWQRRHEAVLQWFLRHPAGTRVECAAATGYTPTHISRITGSAEFRRRFSSTTEAAALQVALARLGLRPPED
jgi:hypothetical protein